MEGNDSSYAYFHSYSEYFYNNFTHDPIAETVDGVCILQSQTDEIILDLQYFIFGPSLFFIIIFGIFGHILTFLIFQKITFSCKRKEAHLRRPRRVRTPKMHKYLAILSIWDLMLLIGSFFLYNLPYLVYGRIRMYGHYVRIYPLAYALVCVSRTGGIWILIASAIDRYFAVCHPFAHRVHITTTRTNLVLVACCLLSFVYGCPRYYHIILEECWDYAEGRWTPVAVGSDLRANPVYWYAYKIGADFTLVSVGPFIILLYLSLAVGLVVRKSMRSRSVWRKLNLDQQAETSSLYRTRRTSALTSLGVDGVVIGSAGDTQIPSIRRHEKSQRRRSYQETQASLNFMLVTVLSKFLFCHSLPAVLDVCETTMEPTKFQTPFMDNLVQAANALVIVNGSMNFVLYLICSRQFRIGVRRMLCSGLRRHQSRESTAVFQSTLREHRAANGNV